MEFLQYDFNYVSHNFFNTCWQFDVESESIEDAIKKGYEYKKEKGMYSFIIIENHDLNKFLFDSKVYDETGKYKAEDQ